MRFASMLLALALGCGGGGDDAEDSGPADAGSPADAGGVDAGPAMDAGRPDAGDPDAGREQNDAGTPDAGPPIVCEGGDTYFYVLDVVAVGEEGPEGVAPGFDLDGRVSDASDRESCFQEDFVSPDGVPGVDNQMAVLKPTIDSLTGVDFNDNLAASVRGGSLLVLVQLDGVDDFTDDDCVALSIFFGELPAGVPAPDVGPDGRFEPDQTFDVSASSIGMDMRATIHLSGLVIADGVLRAGPITLPIRAELPEGTFELVARDATIEVRPSAGALTDGLLGGGVSAEEAVAAVSMLSDALPATLIRGVLNGVTDLDRDDRGQCKSFSIGALLEGVSATRGVVR